MATFTKRGDKWFVQVRRKGFPTSCRSFRQKSDADEWARHMEIKADRGELPTPTKELGKHTVRSILERYRDEISVKKKSHDNERHILNALMRQPFAPLSLAEIRAAKFADYRDMRLKTVKAGTIRRELALLKHAFDIAQKLWALPVRENPLDRLPKIRPQAGRTRRLEEGEYEKIVQAADDTRNSLILDFATSTFEKMMQRTAPVGMEELMGEQK